MQSSAPFSSALAVIWGSLHSSIFLLTYFFFINIVYRLVLIKLLLLWLKYIGTKGEKQPSFLANLIKSIICEEDLSRGFVSSWMQRLVV